MARGARGVWGMLPQKILKSESLKTQFPALSADRCVKKVPKIDYFLLNLAKKNVVISYIFKIDNYCHIPIQLMLAKYDTSFFYEGPKNAQWSPSWLQLGTHLDIQDKSDKFYDNFKKTCFSASC